MSLPVHLRLRPACLRRLAVAVTFCLLCFRPLPAWPQQSYVGRYDAFAGYTYLGSPNLNLAERGFHLQVGVRPKAWYSLGFDYSLLTGHTNLTPSLLTAALQQQLGAEFAQLAKAGVIPPTYSLSVPIDSKTDTFAAGPQLAYRRWKEVTLYLRPSIGAIHEIATAHITDPLESSVVAQLAPSKQKTDWVPFYGVGGGFDVNVSQYVGIRIQGDFVHDHLYSDLLKDGRNSFRFSVGPAFQFGRNIAR